MNFWNGAADLKVMILGGTVILLFSIYICMKVYHKKYIFSLYNIGIFTGIFMVCILPFMYEDKAWLAFGKDSAGSISHIECDTIIMDEKSKSDTIPFNEIHNSQVSLEHEAKVSKISEEQLYYLMSRGLSEAEATEMIVMGFVEPFTKELPMEYAVELNRLISYEMEGSVG